MSSAPVRHADTIIFPASLDPNAVQVVRRLAEADFESYLVGGCVRDLLLGQIPKDFDVSTAARPRQIRRLFRNCRVIGRRFKLAHVHFGEQIIEVATFRKNPTESAAESAAESTAEDGEGDGGEATETSESAHSEKDGLLIVRDNVYGSAEEDVLRRDFTMNALLYDVQTEEVIDYVGGVADLDRKELRTIGDPDIRLAEDPVRMLRAVKFTSRLELSLHPDLDAAMRASADLISQSAPPRVLEEIYKLLTCGRAKTSLDMLVEYGLLERLLPEIADYWTQHRETLRRVGAALDAIDRGRRKLPNAFLLACLLHDPWRAQLAQSEGADAMATARDLIGPAAQRMSVPRRDVAIAKQLLLLQLRLERSRRGRRFRMSEFLSRPSTVDSLQLLFVRSLTGTVDPELHARWAERLGRHEGTDRSPDRVPEESRPRSRRSRRRRGGRRSDGRRRNRERRPSAEGERAAAESNTAAPAESSADGAPKPRSEPAVARSPAPPVETAAPAPAASAETAAAGVAGAAEEGAKPSGVKRWVKAILRRVSGKPTDEPAASATASPPPSGSSGPVAAASASVAGGTSKRGSETASSPATESSAQSEDEAAKAPDSNGGRRRRRRRRRRSSRGRSGTEGASKDEGAVQDESVAAESSSGDDSSSSSGRSRSRRRRRRGGSSRGGSGGGSGGDSGSGSGSGRRSGRSDERSSGGGRNRRKGRSGSRSKGRSGSSSSKQDKPRDESESSGPPQRHPEDIEDFFDW